MLAGKRCQAHFAVNTLGFSRRLHFHSGAAKWQAYNVAYRACPKKSRRKPRAIGVHEEVSGDPQRPGGTRLSPAQDANAEVYKDLGYRQAGMVLHAIDNPKMSTKDSPGVESQMKENPCGQSNHRTL